MPRTRTILVSAAASALIAAGGAGALAAGTAAGAAATPAVHRTAQTVNTPGVHYHVIAGSGATAPAAAPGDPDMKHRA